MLEIKELEHSQIEITGEISAEDFDAHRKNAMKRLGDSVEIPGFRKGHIPESVLKEKIGEGAILQEMAELAISKAYPEIVMEHTLEVIGRPEIVITKVAHGNPLGFKIKTAVLPRPELPDYKVLASKILPTPPIELVVTEKELDETMGKIKENFLQFKKAQEKKEEHSPQPGGEGAILGPDGMPIKGAAPTSKEAPAELTDELVKQLGPFENLEAFKKHMRENIGAEKKMRAKEKRRTEIIESLLQNTKLIVPAILVESEQQKMLAEFKGNIAGMGLKPEDYFKKLGKTEEDMMKEWSSDAEKRVKTYLILQKIGEKEHIIVPEEELERETNHLLEHHKDVPRDRIRSYLTGVLQNEKVFQFLENNNNNPNTPNE